MKKHNAMWMILLTLALLVAAGAASAQTGGDPTSAATAIDAPGEGKTPDPPSGGDTPSPGNDVPAVTVPFTLNMDATATPDLAAGLTITETMTPTATLTPASPVVFLPFINVQRAPTQDPTPPDRIYVCRNPDLQIPDKNPAGAADVFVLSDGRYIHDLDVRLNIDHTWVSDLVVTITHLDSGRQATLIDRPLYPSNPAGCRNDDVDAILDDEMTLSVDGQCSGSPSAVAGMFRPQEPLSTFDGDSLAGTWKITVADHANFDTGEFAGWCISALVGSSPPVPTPPPVFDLPSQARVYNVPSVHQALPLDCESRVAVDWAAFFGTYIDEFEFFRRLPHSDNPDAGFVGSVYGTWGQIPPDPYGVHADPVAEVLGDYGVAAHAHRPLSWDALRAEIAAGRPVYVWTIGSGVSRGIPIYYTAQDAHTSIVARYEHTIMVVGYTDSTVTILDGGVLATRTLDEFLGSWSALGQMAITARQY